MCHTSFCELFPTDSSALQHLHGIKQTNSRGEAGDAHSEVSRSGVVKAVNLATLIAEVEDFLVGRLVSNSKILSGQIFACRH